MTIIVTRAGKGSALSWVEADANLTNLNNDKLEASALAPYATTASVTAGLSTKVNTSDIGTTVQAYSANLTEYATVNPTIAGLALLDDVDNTAQRTTLGLGTSAVLDVGTSANQIVQLDGTGKLPAVDGSQLTNINLEIPDNSIEPVKLTQKITHTSVITASGTFQDSPVFPSWATRITVVLDAISFSATGIPLLQLIDTGGVETTGYSSAATRSAAASVTNNSSSGFILSGDANAAWLYTGHIVLTKNTGNRWIASGLLSIPSAGIAMSGGNKTLSDVLTQVRLTTTSGSDLIDAGTISFIYEG